MARMTTDWNGKAEPWQIHDTGWALIYVVVAFTLVLLFV